MDADSLHHSRSSIDGHRLVDDAAASTKYLLGVPIRKGGEELEKPIKFSVSISLLGATGCRSACL